MDLFLASSSPRRHALLRSVGIEFAVHASNAAEVWPELPPHQAVLEVAEHKLTASWRLWPQQADDAQQLWLAADTAVVVDDVVLGKPRDAAHAAKMLRRLSGRSHEVVTGFVMGRARRTLCRQCVTTEVVMRPYGEAELTRYVATQEPMDKAGAYAIQGLGQALVAQLYGSLTNVVGLPLQEVLVALAKHAQSSPAVAGP